MIRISIEQEGQGSSWTFLQILRLFCFSMYASSILRAWFHALARKTNHFSQGYDDFFAMSVIDLNGGTTGERLQSQCHLGGGSPEQGLQRDATILRHLPNMSLCSFECSETAISSMLRFTVWNSCWFVDFPPWSVFFFCSDKRFAVQLLQCNCCNAMCNTMWDNRRP